MPLKSAYFFNFKFSKVSVDNTCNPYERLSHKILGDSFHN